MRKTFITTLLLAVFSALVSVAQPPQQDPEEVAEKRTSQLAKALELTEKQQDEIYDLFYAQVEGISDLRGSGMDRSEMRTYMEKQREEVASKMKEILTEEQFKKFQEISKEQQGQRGRGPRPF